MKKFVFLDENTDIEWGFGVLIDDNVEEDVLDELVDDLLDDSHDYNGEDLESTYGVHDVSFDTEDTVLGFTSYEIDEDKFPELMEKWRDIFSKRGYKTTEVSKTIKD